MLKKVLNIGLIALLSSVALAQQAPAPGASPTAGTQHTPHPTRAKKLTNAEFDAYLEHPDQVLLVDVRRPDEVSTIGGFPVYLSIQIGDLKNHLKQIPRDRPIITVSNHAGRASIAADLLDDAGFKVLGAIGADTYQTNGGKQAILIPVPAKTDKPGPRPNASGAATATVPAGSN